MLPRRGEADRRNNGDGTVLSIRSMQSDIDIAQPAPRADDVQSLKRLQSQDPAVHPARRFHNRRASKSG
jgi:hypothetical protein